LKRTLTADDDEDVPPPPNYLPSGPPPEEKPPPPPPGDDVPPPPGDNLSPLRSSVPSLSASDNSTTHFVARVSSVSSQRQLLGAKRKKNQ